MSDVKTTTEEALLGRIEKARERARGVIEIAVEAALRDVREVTSAMCEMPVTTNDLIATADRLFVRECTVSDACGEVRLQAPDGSWVIGEWGDGRHRPSRRYRVIVAMIALPDADGSDR